jgi:phosphinothricin acetyltransferase
VARRRGDGEVVGYAYAAPFRAKPAYARTVETTIYLRSGHGGRGLGRALYEPLLSELAARDFHLVVAGMTLPNAASQALHRALGFRPVGTFAQVGFKHGAWWDVEFLQRPL